MRQLTFILLLAALGGGPLFSGTVLIHQGGGHPSDGPDVDLRVRLEEGRVTLQAVMNLAFCDEVVASARRSDEELSTAEQRRLEADLLRLFEREVRLAIDGIPVSASEHSFEVLPFDPALAENFPQMGMLAVIKVRLELVYTLKADPASVGLTWKLHPIDTALAEFVETPIEVKAEWTAFGDVSIVDLPVDRPEYVWRAAEAPPRRLFLEVPPAPTLDDSDSSSLLAILVGAMGLLVACVLMGTSRGSAARRIAGAIILLPSIVLIAFGGFGRKAPATTVSAPAENEARAIFQALHTNIYRAFDYGEEERVYDALSRSVSGQLLDETYNEIYRSLVLQEHGGAVCRVDEVTRVETQIADLSEEEASKAAAFLADARWRVRGQVYHWGHTHERTNEYRAEYRVSATPQGWRIDRAKLIEQFRISATNNGSASEETR
jgi:hypothetical protein